MSRLKRQAGFTVIELLAGMIGFVVLFGAIMEMTIVATHNHDRISQRVGANQRARPMMTRIMDGLRSACVAPRVAPIAPGSTATSMTFVSKSGQAVTPVPDRRILTLTGTTLTENVFRATGGTAPSWTFSGTPEPGYPRTLMTNVTAPGGVMFRYYDYVNGQLNPNPLPVPLSATNAARTAYVAVSLTVRPISTINSPGGVSSQDTRSPITLSDGADLRLESAGQVTATDNLPCM
jgi:hypothetical protein